jgi:hypothetical protein
MGVDKEKLESLITINTTDTVKRNRQRIRNRHELRQSQFYAMEILDILDNSTCSRIRLGVWLGISKVKVDELLTGKKVISDDLKEKLSYLIGIDR